MTKSKRGGAREGAGAPLKSEAEGVRKMWSGRLSKTSFITLRRYATEKLSQSEIIDEALELWRRNRKGSGR